MPRYINIGVNGSINWTASETFFRFGRHKIIIMPPTDQCDASLHMDMDASALYDGGAISIFRQILSRCVWIEGQPAKLLFGWSGNPVAVSVPRHLGPSNLSLPRGLLGWPYDFQPLDAEPARALAFYREAINLQSDGYIELSILNFYRLLEIRYRKGQSLAAWLESALARILESDSGRQIADVLGHLPREPSALAKFIREQCRNAAAHANSPDIDPDNAEASRERSRVLRLMDQVAKEFIVEHFRISRDRWSGT